MNNWTSFHLEHFQAHCKNSVSLSIEVRLALKGPWYRVSLSVPFQQRFTTTEGELLNLLHGLHAFRQYLAGRQQFLVRTDHWALKWIRKLNPNSRRLAGWLYEIDSHFTFDVKHRPGKLHKVPDGLSRLPATHLGNSGGEQLGGNS
jgi:hypothetical protein